MMHIKSLTFIFFTLCLVIQCNLSRPAIANENEKKLDDLPEVKNMSAEDFRDLSRLINQDYSDYPSFSFKMNLPKNLRVIPQDQLINKLSSSGVSGTIFHAIGPATNALRPYVKVTVNDLDRLISAKNWFIAKVLREGYTLKAIESYNDDIDFDAFFVRLDTNGNTEIVRGKGFLNNDQLVMIEYSIPVGLWSSDRDKQILSIQSFEFTNEYDVTSPEIMKVYRYLDSFQIKYPKSWILKSDPVAKINEIKLNFQTADQAGFLLAEIYFSVLSSRSLRDRLDKIQYSVDIAGKLQSRRDLIDEAGYVIDDLMGKEKITVNFLTDTNITEVYTLRRKQSDIYVNIEQAPVSKEYWVTFIRRPEDVGKNYIVTMMAPYRMNNIEQWAIAVETYRRMIKSIQ